MKGFKLWDLLENDIRMLCLLSKDPTDSDGTKFIECTEKLEEHVEEFIKKLKERFPGPGDDKPIYHTREYKWDEIIKEIEKITGKRKK